MKFSRQNFNAHISNIGQNVKWMRSWACPCMDRNTGSPKPNCPHCFGRGRLWDEPIEIVMGVASQATQVKWAKMGMWEHGDMVVVIPENCPAWDNSGQFDRFITQDGLDGFSEVFTHGAPNEKLRVPVNSVMRCFWFDPADPSQIVEGGIPHIDKHGRPTWTEGEPPPGVQYSITGDRFSEYYMLDAYPDDRNQHQGMRLPKRIVLRKWDLYGRSSRATTY